MIPSRRELQEARQQLIKSGWKEEYSIMSDDKGDKRYGIRFTKEDKEFWLNKDTISSLQEK